MSNALTTGGAEVAVASLQPRNIAEAMEYCKFLATSDIVPKDYRGKPANIFLALQFASRLGMDAYQTMQNVSVINGRPSIWGDLMWAIVTGHPQCQDAKEWSDGSIDYGSYRAHCSIKRSTRSEPVVASYGIDDAKKARLWGKQGPWQTDPKRMMQMRARGFAARDAFADALKGLIAREEAEDYHVKDEHGQPTQLPKGPVVDAHALPADSIRALLDRIDSVRTRAEYDAAKEAAAAERETFSGTDQARIRLAFVAKAKDMQQRAQAAERVDRIKSELIDYAAQEAPPAAEPRAQDNDANPWDKTAYFGAADDTESVS